MDNSLGSPDAVLRFEQYSTFSACTWRGNERKATAMAACRPRIKCSDGMAEERDVEKKNSDAKLSSSGKTNVNWAGVVWLAAGCAEGGENGYG